MRRLEFCSLTRCATTSVSVSLSKYAPARDQFVAQRLEILDDAIVHQRDVAVACGCALLVVGAPCVAQRVCAIPVFPGSGSAWRACADEVVELAFGAAAVELPAIDDQCKRLR